MSKPSRAQQRAELADNNNNQGSTALDDKYRAAELARRASTPTRR